jgi:hypothetical protein
VGNVAGENALQPSSKGAFLKLSAAVHDRIVNDSSGRSGKVHAGRKESASIVVIVTASTASPVTDESGLSIATSGLHFYVVRETGD